VSRTQSKVKPSHKGVIVGYLSGGDTRVEFTKSIGAMTAHSVSTGSLIGALPHVSGPRIAAGRNHLVESFLATPGEWLFMVDDDMTFDSDVIERFLSVADPVKAPIVGGLAFATGRDGIFPTMFRIHPEFKVPTRIDQWPLGEVVEVDGTGAACLFIHRSVFERMAEEFEKPWQWFQETTLNGNTVGEDMTFCLRARALGFPILVDTSIQFGHVKPRIIDENEYFRWLDTHRFVITGTGRSGTGFLATALLFCRVRCGHEELFTPAGRVANPFLRGDASWMALPHLDRFTGYVLHAVRHPLDTIRSMVGIHLFDDEDVTDERAPYQEFIKAHSDVWEFESPVERAMAFYVEWNRRIEPYAHKRVRVEDVTGQDLYDLIHYSGAKHAPWEIQQNIDAVPRDVNTRVRPELEWADLPDGELKSELELLAKEYGYDI
jgi:hypothetical protein